MRSMSPNSSVSDHHLHCKYPCPTWLMAERNPSSSSSISKHGDSSTNASKTPSPPPTLDLGLYPTPLSPPYPERSRDVELRRAMSASSRSALFAFAKSHVVFEDDWLLVVNKPRGVYCESVLSSYSSSVSSSMDNDEVAVAPELHLANRLDRDTSGLMVITKSHKVAAKLVKDFTEHKVRKTYIALCIGHCDTKWQRVRVVSGHGRSKHGAWRVYGVPDIGSGLPGGSIVKHMETMFQILSLGENGILEDPMELVDGGNRERVIVAKDKAVEDGGCKRDEFLVRAYPRSGRTHQIRLHCQYLGMPIMGDVKYGGVEQWKGVDLEYHNLHAETLSFDHPVTGISLQFEAPLPSWVSKCSKK